MKTIDEYLLKCPSEGNGFFLRLVNHNNNREINIFFNPPPLKRIELRTRKTLFGERTVKFKYNTVEEAIENGLKFLEGEEIKNIDPLEWKDQWIKKAIDHLSNCRESMFTFSMDEIRDAMGDLNNALTPPVIGVDIGRKEGDYSIRSEILNGKIVDITKEEDKNAD